MANACVSILSMIIIFAAFSCAHRNVESFGGLKSVLKRQVSNSTSNTAPGTPTTSFQAGGSPSSANGQRPTLFVQPNSFIDPSFSASSGAGQQSGSASNSSSSPSLNPGGSSPFMPSFIDPSKFLSPAQLTPVFPGAGGGTSGPGGGSFPPGTGNASSSSPGGTAGANGNTGGAQSMYPNMFINPNQFG